ncbi:hypothetical protein [Paremcibacter congregatus]|uniref:Uncharacterized protein n=1 Tax=Paremcibacter congregatus TaxID=2043170 RepID=A0A2G4YUE2_9PROT|nr:hypothetical protein [Paremcibacter congregatus]PHZ85951.1 hypothetical protein CRD36_04565 [Paremcibacter congregatus]QDE26916.1 hypothetical protein FIV45_06335 [Paremcibacter congregatus]
MTFNPLKRRKYGSTKAVISELFRQVGGIPKVMEILDIGRTRAYDFTDPNGDAELSLERVEKLVRETDATVISEHFAFLAGGVFLPIETLEEDVDWHGIASRASQKNAANIGGILDSISPTSVTPGYIDAEEARQLIKKLDQHFSLLAHQRQLLVAIIENEDPDDP